MNILKKIRIVKTQYIISILAFFFIIGILLFVPTINLIRRQVLDAVALQYVKQTAGVLNEAQSVYTKEIVSRLKDLNSMNISHDYHTKTEAIPLPFTYLKAIGNQLVEEGSDLQMRIYSDYPFPWRLEEESNLDEYEKEALQYLKANPDQEYYRYQQQGNERILRYTIPSVLKPSCINCHNTYPNTPKTDWQVGDVRGILEFKQIIRDYDLPIYSTLRKVVILISMVSFIGGIGLLISLQKSLQYSRQLEKSVMVRQEAMDEAFTSIHNGPLQTLALILRQIQEPKFNQNSLYQQLKLLNKEIRDIGKYLTEESRNHSLTLTTNPVASKTTMMLGGGSTLDLTKPLHELFYDTYTLTLQRDFPYFAGIKVKVCDFAPLELTDIKIKEKLCRWLEESLCNVGKHAQGVKRLTVVGKKEESDYILRVEDNGCGLTSNAQNLGTKNSEQLARQLQGHFKRGLASHKGTICELSFPLG